MKLIFYILCISLFYQAKPVAQQSDISSLLIYRKFNENWNLSLKYEFIRSSSVQSNIVYKWKTDHWKKTSIQTRELSPDHDTLQTYIINFNADPPKRVQAGKCYKVRNDTGQQIGVMFELDSKLYTSQVPDGFTPLDSLPGGTKLSYPYQYVFQEAEKLFSQDEAIENIKPTYHFCRELQRVDEVFTLAVDEQKKLISFESDSTKVMVIYNGKDGEQKGVNGVDYIYPNPFYDDLFISLNEAAIERLVVMNYLGEIVYSSTVDTGQPILQISLNHIPAGVYFVNILSEKSTRTTKVLKID